MPDRRMTNAEAQAADERAVFADFVKAARLRVVPESIQSRPPPEPDILCEIGGVGPVAFELVQLVDQDLAHGIALAIRDPDNAPGISFGDPTLERVQVKLRREYETPYPMELLAWGDDTLFPRDIWAPTFEAELRALFDAARSPFRRLWVVNVGRLAASDPVWLVHPRPARG
jgi:hypothetical protein